MVKRRRRRRRQITPKFLIILILFIAAVLMGILAISSLVGSGTPGADGVPQSSPTQKPGILEGLFNSETPEPTPETTP